MLACYYRMLLSRVGIKKRLGYRTLFSRQKSVYSRCLIGSHLTTPRPFLSGLILHVPVLYYITRVLLTTNRSLAIVHVKISAGKSHHSVLIFTCSKSLKVWRRCQQTAGELHDFGEKAFEFSGLELFISRNDDYMCKRCYDKAKQTVSLSLFNTEIFGTEPSLRSFSL